MALNSKFLSELVPVGKIQEQMVSLNGIFSPRQKQYM